MKIGRQATLLLTTLALADSQRFNDERFEQAAAKLEQDAQELRDEVEGLYANRCNSALSNCFQSNYHECLSQFPQASCPAGVDFLITQCDDDSASTTRGFFDFTASSFGLPPGAITQRDQANTGSPTDPNLIETVCFTRTLDTWFQEKRQRDAPFWEPFGFAPQSMYFGSNTGAFRIYPARHSENCQAFDPRIRPWYVAGSSGQKNVVLVLDTSGSMRGLRITLLKDAAIRIVDTLTVGDRVAIVPFSGNARVIGDQDDSVLYTVTAENQAILKDAIRSLRADGATNFQAAFTTAFDVLDRSIDQEFHVPCNTAILFLTDGEMTEPRGVTEADILQLVQQRKSRISERLNNKPVLLFAYSISESDSNVHAFPSRLACSTPFGISSKITDPQEIVPSLSSYYLLFALGLGSDSNQGFAAWVEPYIFATGNVLGTTVSVPVYDRSKNPHLFLGVVGVDIVLNALDAALGAGGNEESIRRIAIRSTASCPALNLTACELESYRRGTSGEESRCLDASGSNNVVCSDTDFVQTQAESCDGVSDYPNDLIANRDLAGQSYTENVCCDHVTGEKVVPRSNQDVGVIAGSVVGGIAGLVIIVLGLLYFRRQENCCKKKPDYNSGSNTPESKYSHEEYKLPPPTAPQAEEEVKNA